MATSEKDYLLNNQAKDRMKLLTFTTGDNQQTKGILLASSSQEMLRSLIQVLKMDDKR